jgi:hypothetical protein
VIYTLISKDALGDGHGIANQLADLEKRGLAPGWTVTRRLSDNDIGVTRKGATAAGKHRPGYAEVLRLVNAREVDVVFCWRWARRAISHYSAPPGVGRQGLADRRTRSSKAKGAVLQPYPPIRVLCR